MVRLSLATVLAAVFAVQARASETFMSRPSGPVVLAALQGAPASASPARRVPDQLIIAFKEGVQVQFTKQPSGKVPSGQAVLDDVNRRHKLREVQQSSARREYLFFFEKGVDLDQAIREYQGLTALVDYVQPNFIVGHAATSHTASPPSGDERVGGIDGSSREFQATVARVQDRLQNMGPGFAVPSFDGAARHAGTRGPVSASGTQAKPRNSVTFVGGAGSVDASGNVSTTFGGLYRRRLTPDRFPGSIGVDIGLVGTGSGGAYQVLERDVYRPHYGYEEVYEVVRSVPGTRAWEFGAVSYETPRLGPVSFEGGLRTVGYSDDPRYTVRENNYTNELVYRDCYDRDHDRYYRCDYWTTHNLGGRVLEQGTGTTASGFGHTRYGAVNVRVHRNVDIRVEAAKTNAGRASGTGVRFGGRLSW